MPAKGFLTVDQKEKLQILVLQPHLSGRLVIG